MAAYRSLLDSGHSASHYVRVLMRNSKVLHQRDWRKAASRGKSRTVERLAGKPETSQTVRDGLRGGRKMKAAFWRFAHSHYHAKPPSAFTDAAALTWGVFFILVYVAALMAGWQPNGSEAIIGATLIGAPLTFGILHRRIRLEASKGSDALYRKRLETSQ